MASTIQTIPRHMVPTNGWQRRRMAWIQTGRGSPLQPPRKENGHTAAFWSTLDPTQGGRGTPAYVYHSLSIHIFCQDTSVVKNDVIRIYAHLNTGAHDLAQFTDKADATMGCQFEFPMWKELPLSNILGRLLRDEHLAFSKALNTAKHFRNGTLSRFIFPEGRKVNKKLSSY
ncbi:uncharacterized protein BJ171DRAFT_571720 [Polychytrium aggregatum]|uniref:uncharacterized protein n=1 Tax=Polychytrium aggregatum TaxID=110093 RepID=UPI0022FDC0B5|nr:uncharacterized protein BJ171DRAFT_571720 [Polychytrium aggregatum]KAI9193523.1 hypothetical protein BJ171DRAFT_571720 [Polychytrium aggregatum]